MKPTQMSRVQKPLNLLQCKISPSHVTVSQSDITICSFMLQCHICTVWHASQLITRYNQWVYLTKCQTTFHVLKSLTNTPSCVKSSSFRKWFQQNKNRTELFFMVDDNIVDQFLNLQIQCQLSNADSHSLLPRITKNSQMCSLAINSGHGGLIRCAILTELSMFCTRQKKDCCCVLMLIFLLHLVSGMEKWSISKISIFHLKQKMKNAI